MLERMSKVFKLELDDNATTKKKTVQDNNNQRTASVVTNNIQPDEQDSLCANMISEVVKVAAERVNNKSKQSRTASVTTSTKKVDEVALLKSFLSR